MRSLRKRFVRERRVRHLEANWQTVWQDIQKFVEPKGPFPGMQSPAPGFGRELVEYGSLCWGIAKLCHSNLSNRYCGHHFRTAARTSQVQRVNQHANIVRATAIDQRQCRFEICQR